MSPIQIRCVHHFGRLTKRLEESRMFYREILGFREIQRPNFDFDGAWLYNYGVQIHLIVNPAAPDPVGEINSRVDHVALHVDDLDAARDRLIAAGIPFKENSVPGRNIRQLFFRDPDGHHIELATYPETPPFIS